MKPLQKTGAFLFGGLFAIAVAVFPSFASDFHYHSEVTIKHEDHTSYTRASRISQQYSSHQKEKETEVRHENYKNYFLKSMFSTSLDGSQETPKSGDPDGRGFVMTRLESRNPQVCVSIHVKNISTATAAHIHKAPKGSAGPVVVALPTPDSDGNANGCVGADMDLIQDISRHPEEYYVNIHSTEYPDGAVRGQIGR